MMSGAEIRSDETFLRLYVDHQIDVLNNVWLQSHPLDGFWMARLGSAMKVVLAHSILKKVKPRSFCLTQTFQFGSITHLLIIVTFLQLDPRRNGGVLWHTSCFLALGA